MSQTKKTTRRGISMPLVNVTLPKRASRHGQPVTKRVRKVVEIDGQFAVVYENVPAEERTLRVAQGPTAKYGQKNTSPTVAKKEKKEAAKK